MTFAGWKLDLDSELNPEVSIDDAYDLTSWSQSSRGQRVLSEIAAIRKNAEVACGQCWDSGNLYFADPYQVHHLCPP